MARYGYQVGAGRGWQALGEGLLNLGALLSRERGQRADDERLQRAEQRQREQDDLRLFEQVTEGRGGMGPLPPEPGKPPTAVAAPDSLSASIPWAGKAPSEPRFLELPGGRGYVTRPGVLAAEEAKAGTIGRETEAMRRAKAVRSALDQ